ncbi:MAG: aminopeptidase [Clostridiales bacterium]|nr:aminopeptidase [Clostridiales bacterium]
MQKTRLRRYARMIARIGANVQPGQDAFIFASIEQPEFVALLTEELYKAGARKVHVRMDYQPLGKIHHKYCSLETLSAVEEMELAELQFMVDRLPCRIALASADPDGGKGIDVEKANKSGQARHPITYPYREKIDGKHQWCIAAVPGVKWAKKIFPGERAGRAVEKLWQAILDASRINEDPVAAWNEHHANLASRCEYLNTLDIETLEFKASNGTDLRVGMIPEAIFCGGGETTKDGVFFTPNVPTEECFITPMRGVAEGIVYSTKPYPCGGELIEQFSLRFENGKVVEVHADTPKNEENLIKMLDMDEGARYLGECALVPFSSPINQTGILFYNTLFDENACCHLAMGRGYADTIRNHHNMTREEINALGVNQSMIHSDFMIGTADMSVTAYCRDGKVVKIFENGDWAF